MGELSEAELQQQEVMTEDSLSNDEYECVSPDDISLPPLAETPESIMVQSDNEEGLCFGSHSVHINHYSQHYHTQSEHSGTGPVRQQRESSQTEGYPTPPAFLQGSKRSVLEKTHSGIRTHQDSFYVATIVASSLASYTKWLCAIARQWTLIYCSKSLNSSGFSLLKQTLNLAARFTPIKPQEQGSGLHSDYLRSSTPDWKYQHIYGQCWTKPLSTVIDNYIDRQSVCNPSTKSPNRAQSSNSYSTLHAARGT